MSDNSTKANLIAKILFIAGGIILFIVLVIFIFRMVPIAISNIANIGSTVTTSIKKTFSGDEIKISTESDVIDIKNPFIVSFEYTPVESTGQYYISYNCIDGLFFDIQSKDGPKRIICNTPLKLGSKISSISLAPVFTKTNNFADSIINITYKDTDGNTVASGSKTITIKSGESSEENISEENPYEASGAFSGSELITQPIEDKTITNTTKPSTYTKSTKDLVLTKISPTNADSSFVINVYNYGNTSTGPWEFSYTDAENPSRTILSPIQASLKSGQGLAITVRFDGQDNSKETINVVVDPNNKISETSESNNSGSTTITGDSSNYNNDNDYNSNDDADLVITDIEVGKLSRNNFIQDSEINDDDTAAIRFIVKNQGGESTGSWKFEINNLPYDYNETYESKSYSSLKPGQSIEILADFDGIDEGRYSIEVEVDSDDDVDEEKENNNTESETLEVSN